MSQVPNTGTHPDALGVLLRNVALGQETAVEVAREILPEADGKPGASKTTVALQGRVLNPEPPAAPQRAESPPRCHHFFEVDGFAAYLKTYGSAGTVVLADPAEREMKAVLDERAGTGFEVVTFTPQLHPVFAPWHALMEVDEEGDPVTDPTPIRQFVDFVARNKRCITGIDTRELIMALAQVRMSRSVELHQGSGNKSLNGILIKTKVEGAASGSGERSDYFDFPETLTVKAPLFIGSDPVELLIDLTISGNEQTGVVVRLSSGDLLTKMVDEFDRMFTVIRGALPTATVGLGKPSWDLWRYLGK